MIANVGFRRHCFENEKTSGFPSPVFATVSATGWVMGIPNGDAPSKLVAPLSRSPDVHNKAVVDYFVGAGLPTNQIGRVNAHATMHATMVGDVPSAPVFDGYSSVISRKIAGILVPDSFACATFNVDGDVVEESVYWPAIPADVLNAAQALQTRLADLGQASNFLSRLPAGVTGGQVVVRHSSGGIGATFEAAASFDVQDASGGMGRVRHFNSNAVEFQMLGEQQSPIHPSSPKK
jgi:hypothetical protein